MPRILSNPSFVLLVVLVTPGFARISAHAQPKEAAEINRRALELYRAGKAGGAIPLTKRVLEIIERERPPGHPDIALSLNKGAKSEGPFRSR